jgi:hypothetical protein
VYSTAQVDQPAVVVKIDNVDQARPQTGINQADVVYEEMVEGGLTRLAAVFQSQYPALLGPVRSGRLTDEGIADDLSHPVYVFAGTNANFYPILDAQPVTSVNPDDYGGLFYRIGDNAPHNYFIHVPQVAAVSTTHSAPAPLFTYVPKGRTFGGAGAGPAASVSVDFPAAAVNWTYNAGTRTWLRAQNGTPDVDSTGKQISAANVVLLFVPYIQSGVASGEGVAPTPIPEGLLTGSGAVWVLSAGKVVRGTWTRPGLTTPATYHDSGGATIAMTPGQTWVELVPEGNYPAVSP